MSWKEDWATKVELDRVLHHTKNTRDYVFKQIIKNFNYQSMQDKFEWLGKKGMGLFLVVALPVEIYALSESLPVDQYSKNSKVVVQENSQSNTNKGLISIINSKKNE